MRIKKQGKSFVLYQNDGVRKRVVETDSDKKRLVERKKFLQSEGGFKGAVPSFMLGRAL